MATPTIAISSRGLRTSVKTKACRRPEDKGDIEYVESMFLQHQLRTSSFQTGCHGPQPAFAKGCAYLNNITACRRAGDRGCTEYAEPLLLHEHPSWKMVPLTLHTGKPWYKQSGRHCGQHEGGTTPYRTGNGKTACKEYDDSLLLQQHPSSILSSASTFQHTGMWKPPTTRPARSMMVLCSCVRRSPIEVPNERACNEYAHSLLLHRQRCRQQQRYTRCF
jgi:hypothetical protein